MEVYFQRVVATRRFQKRSEELFETPYRSKENSGDLRAGDAQVAPGMTASPDMSARQCPRCAPENITRCQTVDG